MSGDRLAERSAQIQLEAMDDADIRASGKPTKIRVVATREAFGTKWETFEWRCECGAIFECGERAGCCQGCFDRIKRERTDAAELRSSNARARETAERLPPRYRWAHFEAPELQARAKPQAAIDRAQKSLDAMSVVLLGPAGMGKTSLACAVLRAAAAHRRVAGLFDTAFFLAKARQEHKLGEGEAPRVQRAAEAKLLLLDELGAELGRNTAVQEVIHERHAYERPTIYTSGFSADDLKSRYGDGIARRIFEGAVVIRLGGT